MIKKSEIKTPSPIVGTIINGEKKIVYLCPGCGREIIHHGDKKMKITVENCHICKRDGVK